MPRNPPWPFIFSGFVPISSISSGEIANPARLHGGTVWTGVTVLYKDHNAALHEKIMYEHFLKNYNSTNYQGPLSNSSTRIKKLLFYTTHAL
jgi:hypothetical protein